MSANRHRRLKFAVIGCGSIGRRHLKNLLELQTTVFAFDPNPVTRQKIRDECGVNCFDSLEDIWRGLPDAALICSPSNLHIRQATEAARHNCHVFIEKPLSHTLEGLEQLQAEVRMRQLVTMVGCNMRFHPGPQTVKKLLTSRAIGQILAARIQTGSYLPRWRPQEDYRQSYSASDSWGGATLDQIHEIDLATWYFGPARLECAVLQPASCLGLETDGLAELMLRHSSGMISSVHLNFIQRDVRRLCQVIGTEGTIDWEFLEGRVRLFGPDGEAREIFHQPDKWKLNQMYLDQLRHFIEAIETNSETMNPIECGLTTLSIALSARQQRRKAA